MKRVALALLVACLAASAWAQSATVEGYKVKVGKRLAPSGEAVAVEFRLHEATLGPQGGVVASGYAVSSLPHEWFKITITIRFWDVYRERNDLFERARATVVLDKPKPGQRVKWRAILWSPHKKGSIEPFAQPNPIYTVAVDFASCMPKPKAAGF